MSEITVGTAAKLITFCNRIKRESDNACKFTPQDSHFHSYICSIHRKAMSLRKIISELEVEIDAKQDGGNNVL